MIYNKSNVSLSNRSLIVIYNKSNVSLSNRSLIVIYNKSNVSISNRRDTDTCKYEKISNTLTTDDCVPSTAADGSIESGGSLML